jgi:hypothetical protein
LTIHNPSKLIASVRFPTSVIGLKDRKLPNGGHFHVVLRSEAFEGKIDGIVSEFAPIVEPSSPTISTIIHSDTEKYSRMFPGLKVIAVPREAAD